MGNKCKILIVDDDRAVKQSLVDWFECTETHLISSASSGEAALELLDKNSYNIVITDLKMPGIDGIEVLRHVKSLDKDSEVIVMTGYGKVDSAVDAMKKGAYDYIIKPFSAEEIDLIVQKILQQQALVRENILLREQLQDQHRHENIIGRSKGMQKIFTLIDNIAPSNSTVLIQGESGTGKELIARAIHNSSPRKENPFIAVNCGALPETILESELFGHERGAFTGAVARKKGRFEMADTGTLFLDEIAEMSAKTQVELLRVLQEKEFLRVGGSEVVSVDVRTVAATNKDLEKEVAAGRFREDLYYRLHVLPITPPPLRDRSEDIPLLVAHFMEKFNGREEGAGIKRISPEAFNVLMRYRWPGNVRELEHAIEHTLLMTKGDVVEVGDLPDKLLKKSAAGIDSALLDEPGQGLKERVEQFEKQCIIHALQNAHGIKKDAARALGLTPRNISYFVNKYNIR